MSAPKDGWLERDGVSLHYVDWAPESEPTAPPILFLHGLSSNARYWDRVARHISGRRMVALDQRGHGLTGRSPRSPQLPEGYATKALVEDAVFLISRLGLDPPVVAGHSWGATIALELVGTRPGLASGLVFIDGPVQGAANLFSWEEAQRLMQPTLPRFASYADAVSASQSDFQGAWGDDLEAFVKARIVDDGGMLVLTLSGPVRLELLRGLYESQPELLWPAIDVPAAALLALRSFTRTSRAADGRVNRLSEIAPEVDVKWFDTPHDIPLYMPAEIASAIDEIARLAAARSESTAG